MVIDYQCHTVQLKRFTLASTIMVAQGASAVPLHNKVADPQTKQEVCENRVEKSHTTWMSHQ